MWSDHQVEGATAESGLGAPWPQIQTETQWSNQDMWQEEREQTG